MTTKVYYNEWDSCAAEWLRNLIKEGNLPDGDVDERSITEVEPNDLKGYTQHHFFAGIGGWPLAIRLAGVSESERIVTGSPPCQPFSTAGQQKGYADERHLAPHWLRLVATIRPTWVFGEQVAAAIRKDDWLDDLLDALEEEGYSTGAIVLPACSVGAPHIRQRIWVTAWLADSERGRCESRDKSERSAEKIREISSPIGVAYPRHPNQRGISEPHEPIKTFGVSQADDSARCSQSFGLADSYTSIKGVERGSDTEVDKWGKGDPRIRHRSISNDVGMVNPSDAQCETRGLSSGVYSEHNTAWDSSTLLGFYGTEPSNRHEIGLEQERASTFKAGWDNPDWLWCRDGKWRPVESGTFPLAHGVSARVGRLRAYGNAIVPQVAAEVIKGVIGEY